MLKNLAKTLEAVKVVHPNVDSRSFDAIRTVISNVAERHFGLFFHFRIENKSTRKFSKHHDDRPSDGSCRAKHLIEFFYQLISARETNMFSMAILPIKFNEQNSNTRVRQNKAT